MANNVIWSTIYIGNFVDIDTNEGNNATENENILLGTHGGPTDQLYKHITDIDTDSSSSRIEEDNEGPNGTLTYDVGGGSTTQRLDSLVTFKGTIKFTDGSTLTNQYIDFIQMQNGDVFWQAWDGDPYLGSKAIESVTNTSVDNDGYQYSNQNQFDDVEFVCFATGTRILTPRGERAVETLSVGDRIETRDHGPQPLIWTASRQLRFPGSPDSQKPILFSAGSLGQGLPKRDLVVSPQHRMFIAGLDVEQAAGCPEAFAAAKSHLVLRRVRIMARKKAVTYHSLMVPAHAVIFAEGAPVESFYPGEVALRLLDPIQRRMLSLAVPGVLRDAQAAYGQTARLALNRQQAENIINNRSYAEKRKQEPLSHASPHNLDYLTFGPQQCAIPPNRLSSQQACAA